MSSDIDGSRQSNNRVIQYMKKFALLVSKAFEYFRAAKEMLPTLVFDQPFSIHYIFDRLFANLGL